MGERERQMGERDTSLGVPSKTNNQIKMLKLFFLWTRGKGAKRAKGWVKGAKRQRGLRGG
jgi:hypothetical protein